MTSPTRTKAKLRAEVLRQRDALRTLERAESSAAISERLLGEAAYRRAKTVAIFVTFRSEVDTLPIIRDILRKGKIAAVPRTKAGGEMEFHRITDPVEDLAPGAHGIREPRAGLQRVRPEEIDLMLAPGTVFDERGHRIGHGGGFFDRYLPRLNVNVPVIALGFELQMVETVPSEAFDREVDMIITEKRVIKTR
jgi:5-formyltetrahydrofolate cyclo-ligase